MQDSNGLWPHQVEALKFAEGKPAVMLSMDMATGKTRVALEIINRRNCKFTLVLCPKSVVKIWPAEFEKHFPGSKLKTIILKGPTSDKALQLATQVNMSHKGIIVITNYESVVERTDKHGNPLGNALNSYLMALIRQKEIDLMILDEGHRIRGHDSKISWFCGEAGRYIKHKLCLTGTPMHNGPLSIYGQYRFLDKTIFPPFYRQFKYQYGYFKKKKCTGHKNLADLHDKFYQIAFRVKADDVLDLPGSMHQIRSFELGKMSRKIYDAVEADFTAELENGRITASNALVWFVRLQQLTSGYTMLDMAPDKPIMEVISHEKEDSLADFLEDIEINEPVVVFCRFRYDLDSIHRVAKRMDFDSAELSGRVNELEKWQESDGPKIMATQIIAGKEGNDYTRARHQVYYSHGLSLGDYEQSMRRILRPGQTRPVLYTHLVAENSIDQRIMNGHAKKGSLVHSILEGYVKK